MSPHVPDDGAIEFDDDDFAALLKRTDELIDKALAERMQADRLQTPIGRFVHCALIDIRLASLVQLRRALRRRVK